MPHLIRAWCCRHELAWLGRCVEGACDFDQRRGRAAGDRGRPGRAACRPRRTRRDGCDALSAAWRRALVRHRPVRPRCAGTGGFRCAGSADRGGRVVGVVEPDRRRARRVGRLPWRLDRCGAEPRLRRIPADTDVLSGAADRGAVRRQPATDVVRHRGDHLAALGADHARPGADVAEPGVRAGRAGRGSEFAAGADRPYRSERPATDRHRRNLADGACDIDRGRAQLPRPGRPEHGQLGTDDLRGSAAASSGAVDVDLPRARHAVAGGVVQSARRCAQRRTRSAAAWPGAARLASADRSRDRSVPGWRDAVGAWHYGRLPPGAADGSGGG